MMSNNALKNDRIVVAGRFALIAFLCSLLWIGGAEANNQSIQFAEKVNLAMRRTAHQLLVHNGDSTSIIPPVQQIDANTFSVRMDHLFEYERLPELLEKSFDVHGVRRGYSVAVLNCETKQLQIGYSYLDLKQKGRVPCKGREQAAGCYVLKVSFEPETKETASSNWWVLPFGSLLAALGFIVWKRSRKSELSEVPVSLPGKLIDNEGIIFGNSVLNLPNLTLLSGNKSYNLTYREAKLLNLFAGNTNRVLERDFILKSVWEDEGIIVGRSIDVFVSRLRKLLVNDPQLKITAVHGIGYRLDVLP